MAERFERLLGPGRIGGQARGVLDRGHFKEEDFLQN